VNSVSRLSIAVVDDARDGHGFVGDTLDKRERGELPVRLAVIPGRLVVTASAAPELPVGTEIATVDGEPAGAAILSHLMAEPENDRWMHVAKIVGPFYETVGWGDFGWNVEPKPPRVAGRVVFLTDGRAISYAESVMGYVADKKLATIVGGTTAGTNGNVASFATPSGFNVSFTGMRVTRHDGSGRHHLVGVSPDVAAAPTVEGLRAGRDEVLEKGLEIARSIR
jgi:peptidase S41-like protein